MALRQRIQEQSPRRGRKLRLLTVTLENIPPSLAPAHVLSARLSTVHSSPEEGAPPEATFGPSQPGGRAVAHLRIAADAHGTLEIHARHVRTGWRTELAARTVRPDQRRVVIDLAGNVSAHRTSWLEARIDLPGDITGALVLRLQSARSGFVHEVKAVREPGQRSLTVSVHGLGSGVYLPSVELAADAPIRWRADFAAVDVRGETRARLQPRRGASIVARIGSAAVVEERQVPWLTVLASRSRRRVASSQRWTDAGIVLAGLAPGVYVLQAATRRLVSRRTTVRVHGAETIAVRLELLPGARLQARAIAAQPGTLAITDLRHGDGVPLGRREADILTRLHKVDLRLPVGSYRLTLRHGRREVRRTVELTRPGEIQGLVVRMGKRF